MKFGRLFQSKYAPSRIFDLTSHFQDGCHNIISCRKVPLSGNYFSVPLSGECSWSVCMAHMQQLPAFVLV